jgi:hypothetical protein
MSRTRPHRLPSTIYEGDAERVGEITSALDLEHLNTMGAHVTGGVQKKTKKNRWLAMNAGKYWKIELEVRVYVGLADLRFEMWFAGQPIGHVAETPVAWTYPRSDRPGSNKRRDMEKEELVADKEVLEGERVDPEWSQGLISD